MSVGTFELHTCACGAELAGVRAVRCLGCQKRDRNQKLSARRRSPLRSKSGKMRGQKHQARETRRGADPAFALILSDAQRELARQCTGIKNIHVQGRQPAGGKGEKIHGVDHGGVR